MIRLLKIAAVVLIFVGIGLAYPRSVAPAMYHHRKPEWVVARREAPEYRELVVEATAYTWTGNRTATGTWPEVGTIAVDPQVIPLGTRMWVEGYGWGRAADTGGLIKGERIDVFLPNRGEALRWGRKPVKVRIYERRNSSDLRVP